MLIKLLLICFLSGMLYRLGGLGKPFKTWMRDWVIPLVWLIGFCLIEGFSWANWWVYLSIWMLMAGALTTYWDDLFGYDNFYAHGFMIGLASFPLLFIGFPIYVILLNGLITGLLMGLWCKFFGNDWVEEIGRGVFVCLPLVIWLVKLNAGQ